MSGQFVNTDREIYTTHDERGDYYGDKIFVTESGGIGFNVGGYCIIRPLRDWHFSLARVAELEAENARLREALENSSAALQAVSDRFDLTDNEVVKFTGKWASRGSITIGDILDQSATALAKEPEE